MDDNKITTIGICASWAMGLALGYLIWNIKDVNETVLDALVHSDARGAVEICSDGWHIGTLTWEPKAERKE